MLVALTGWGQQEDKRLAREAGFDHHMVKPVDPDLLIQVVNQGCQERDAVSSTG